jgi:hypothetical protein
LGINKEVNRWSVAPCAMKRGLLGALFKHCGPRRY